MTFKRWRWVVPVLLVLSLSGFTDTFDVSTPAGSDSPTAGDDRIREMKNAIQQRMNVDHDWALSGNTSDASDIGEHVVVQMQDQGSNPAAGSAKGKFFSKQVSSHSEAHWIDDDGTVPQLTSNGAINVSGTVPAGVIVPYGGSSAPSGYLLCDGTAVSRTTYATLFAITSTTYGVGDGATTFNVPDLRGRLPIGAGIGSGLTARTAGTTYGAETHTHTAGSFAGPSHTHGGT